MKTYSLDIYLVYRHSFNEVLKSSMHIFLPCISGFSLSYASMLQSFGIFLGTDKEAFERMSYQNRFQRVHHKEQHIVTASTVPLFTLSGHLRLAKSHKRYGSHKPLLPTPPGRMPSAAYVTAASTIDSTISCDPLSLSVNFFFFYGDRKLSARSVCRIASNCN